MKNMYWKRLSLADAEIVAPVATNMQAGLLAYVEDGYQVQPGQEVKSAEVNGMKVYAVKLFNRSKRTVTRFVIEK